MSTRVAAMIYLAGPMTGYPNCNFDEFNRVAAILRRDGFSVFNPAENFNGDGQNFSRSENMRLDVPAVLSSDEVCLLRGWERSGGASTEVMLAWQCDIPVTKFVESDGGYRRTPVSSVPSALPYVDGDSSILLEADRLVQSVRRGQYGHPLDDHGKVASMATALFRTMLRDGCEFSPEHVGMFMQLIKLSREVHQHKRDNCVDGAGYWACIEEIHAERRRRSEGQT